MAGSFAAPAIKNDSGGPHWFAAVNRCPIYELGDDWLDKFVRFPYMA